MTTAIRRHVSVVVNILLVSFLRGAHITMKVAWATTRSWQRRVQDQASKRHSAGNGRGANGT